MISDAVTLIVTSSGVLRLLLLAGGGDGVVTVTFDLLLSLEAAKGIFGGGEVGVNFFVLQVEGTCVVVVLGRYSAEGMICA